MYQTRDKAYIPKANADGYYHQRDSNSRRSKGKTRADFEWAECCEYCPYPDCVCTTARVCLVEISVEELFHFIDLVEDMLDRGISYNTIHKEVGVTHQMLYRILDFRVYPTVSVQRGIKAFLEKHKEEWENDKE